MLLKADFLLKLAREKSKFFSKTKVVMFCICNA